jgi:hypothetical protein
MNLPTPSLPEPLAEAGVGFLSSLDFPHDGSDLPLPRRGVLSGKSPRTSRRWRLYFVRFQPLCAGKYAPSFDTPRLTIGGAFGFPWDPCSAPYMSADGCLYGSQRQRSYKRSGTGVAVMRFSPLIHGVGGYRAAMTGGTWPIDGLAGSGSGQRRVPVRTRMHGADFRLAFAQAQCYSGGEVR